MINEPLHSIKFSHNYPKLWNQKEASLICINIIEKTYFPLTKELIEYDTKDCKGNYYPLPKTNYLQLIFLGDKLIPFCTIRRRTPEKEKYYRGLVDNIFQIKIIEAPQQGVKLDD